jgi:uncharacterized protein
LLSLLSAGLKIIVYLLGTVLLAAILAPWFYWAGQHLSTIKSFAFLGDTDFARYFNRSLLFSAFALLIPVLRWIGLHQFTSLGLARNPRRIFHLAGGFVVTTAIVLGLGVCLLANEVAALKEPPPWNQLPRIFLTAIVVALIEESLFRGAILGLFRQSMRTLPAVVVTSALFSILHFLKPPYDQNVDLHWYSGFELLPHVFWQFSDPILVSGLFSSICILGLMLAHAAVKTRSLWLPIGIHAGVVFGKMSFSKLTHRTKDVMPWFGQDLTFGLGSLLILLFLWFLIWLLFLGGAAPSRPNDQHAG